MNSIYFLFVFNFKAIKLSCSRRRDADGLHGEVVFGYTEAVPFPQARAPMKYFFQPGCKLKFVSSGKFKIAFSTMTSLNSFTTHSLTFHLSFRFVIRGFRWRRASLVRTFQQTVICGVVAMIMPIFRSEFSWH